MKKYLLKLIEDDIAIVERQITYWETKKEFFKNDDYQLRRKKALDNKLIRITRYKERIENNFKGKLFY